MQKKFIVLSLGLFGVVVAALIALFVNRPDDVNNTQSAPTGPGSFEQEWAR